MTTSVELLPAEELGAYGVEAGRDDMLNPSAEVQAESRQLLLAMKAKEVVEVAGGMTRSEFADVLREALESLDPA